MSIDSVSNNNCRNNINVEATATTDNNNGNGNDDVPAPVSKKADLKKSRSFEDLMMLRRRPSQMRLRKNKKRDYMKNLTHQALDMSSSLMNIKYNSRGSIRNDMIDNDMEMIDEVESDDDNNKGDGKISKTFLGRLRKSLSSTDLDPLEGSSAGGSRHRRGGRRTSCDNFNTNTKAHNAAFTPPISAIRKKKEEENERDEKAAMEKKKNESMTVQLKAISTTKNVHIATQEVKEEKEENIIIRLTFPPIKPIGDEKEKSSSDKPVETKKVRVTTTGICKTRWW